MLWQKVALMILRLFKDSFVTSILKFVKKKKNVEMRMYRVK